MTHPLRHLMFALLAAFVAFGGTARAANTVDPQDFVDRASESGIAEVEAGKLAEKKAKHPQVKAFAEMMVKDHTAANAELKQLAATLKLKTADDASLMEQAKAKLLEMRDDSFDKAYAENQVKAHQEAVELYRKAAQSDQAQLRDFAQKLLPKLQAHLEQAERLVKELQTDQ
ncbi:putative membrane protein [Pseudomonas sp. SLBN-26]|uniref:DUF4142 domain-containing protein n=1 Tax=Pseudomonadaceae TaxID=135621 RepID=UPI001153EAC2|nr:MULTISPECIES: DUF4142 domain-containing protein [Pseudomonas]MCP1616467.1 putative membrane protein [Pseudomonas otitidis]TQL05722.1 putative membrane protein [Pseudomonas sp. SLBN-26]